MPKNSNRLIISNLGGSCDSNGKILSLILPHAQIVFAFWATPFLDRIPDIFVLFVHARRMDKTGVTDFTRNRKASIFLSLNHWGRARVADYVHDIDTLSARETICNLILLTPSSYLCLTSRAILMLSRKPFYWFFALWAGTLYLLHPFLDAVEAVLVIAAIKRSFHIVLNLT